MNIFKRFAFRFYQGFLFVAQRFLIIDEPLLMSEVDATYKVAKVIKQMNYKKPLIVTGPNIFKHGLCDKLIKGLVEENINYAIFKDVVNNPTIACVEEGLKVFKENDCDCLIALGGGSPMDAAKIIAARAKSDKPILKMRGALKIHNRQIFRVAIPTTAGSGSETTLAAVITNEQTRDKFAISDPHLIPNLAVHDPTLLTKLPSKVTSTTGMDALTHAVEAYLGRANTKKTKECALDAIKLIYENLYDSYMHPEDLEKRLNMLKASYLAGVAFTNAYVGYVHALAHSLGGKYNVPHGLANAILLPYVLEEYGHTIYKKCAKISDYINLCPKEWSEADKTKKFIASIRELNHQMDIPETLSLFIEPTDLDGLVDHAYKEANPFYPVPKIFDKDLLKNIYNKAVKEETL